MSIKGRKHFCLNTKILSAAIGPKEDFAMQIFCLQTRECIG